MIDAASVAVLLDVLRPEREALLAVLGRLGAAQWSLPTECPAYTIKGIATHLLGDDLSLLSRQRDRADSGLVQLGVEMPGVDFGTLLDTFNDRWVAAAGFFSTELIITLLGLSGEWTAAYYEAVDPDSPGEPVAFFGARGRPSPFWHAIGREYLERWLHHSQIRRALGLGSLAEEQFLTVGVELVAAAVGLEPGIPPAPYGAWALGPVALGPAQQAADILTRAHDAAELRALLNGPASAVELLAAAAGRP
jgi:uncharacterized protein (TIGR03083 family)